MNTKNLFFLFVLLSAQYSAAQLEFVRYPKANPSNSALYDSINPLGFKSLLSQILPYEDYMSRSTTGCVNEVDLLEMSDAEREAFLTDDRTHSWLLINETPIENHLGLDSIITMSDGSEQVVYYDDMWYYFSSDYDDVVIRKVPTDKSYEKFYALYFRKYFESLKGYRVVAFLHPDDLYNRNLSRYEKLSDSMLTDIRKDCNEFVKTKKKASEEKFEAFSLNENSFYEMIGESRARFGSHKLDTSMFRQFDSILTKSNIPFYRKQIISTIPGTMTECGDTMILNRQYPTEANLMFTPWIQNVYLEHQISYNHDQELWEDEVIKVSITSMLLGEEYVIFTHDLRTEKNEITENILRSLPLKGVKTITMLPWEKALRAASLKGEIISDL